ncbi:hypothetical protein MKW94_000958 [Papaver nudicaule]|uniref:GOLD domain-containing protein n=1 Tax=Papaver nudicaule TaxID=74823 RepID=A0AA41V7Z2_PAPNU|nr:hypothetical protein [Papaver nudicaule]
MRCNRFMMVMIGLGVISISLQQSQYAVGIRFVVEKEECLSHSIPHEGDTVQVSYVVIKADVPWNSGLDDGVDLIATDPKGDLVHFSRDKTSEKFEFVVRKEGLHRFCFKNKGPHYETVDFDIHIRHFSYHGQHAKDEHLNPLMAQLSKLQQALFDVQFEQHWLEAQTDRQAILNQGMSKRAIHKAMLESLVLIGASILQIYLLRRLFERKLGICRV